MRSSLRSGRCRIVVADAFLVDANVLVYAVAGDELGERCRAILAAVAAGELDGVTSTAVLEELWHLELSGRIGNLSGQTARALSLFAPPLPITAAIFTRALAIEAPAELGANDRIHVATCIEHDIPAILTADRGFDAVSAIERIDPLDRRFAGLAAP